MKWFFYGNHFYKNVVRYLVYHIMLSFKISSICIQPFFCCGDCWTQDIPLNVKINNKNIKNFVCVTKASEERNAEMDFCYWYSYLNCSEPEKPEGNSIIYYIKDNITCPKETFHRLRAESQFRIDEFKAEFKEWSSLKQYNLLKPVKRRTKIKIWLEHVDGRLDIVNLGEKIVKNYAVLYTKKRLYVSADFLHRLVYSCIQTRRNLATFDQKLERGVSTTLCKYFV